MKPAWVFHRGALGDSVLLWPRLRALMLGGHAVTLVTDRSKGRLAAREIGIDAVDIEQERFNALWRETATAEPVGNVALVVDHLSGRSSTHGPDELAHRPVSANLARMFPSAAVEAGPPPTGADARAVVATCPGALAPARDNPHGPAVLHVGAGSEAKRWAVHHWVGLAEDLRARRERVELIAGEVEHERLRGSERAAFEGAGGRFIFGLDALADLLRGARVFAGCDSGPTHLSAALGVRTLALFGPTDPRVWAPVGARVDVVAPVVPSGMSWLSTAQAATALAALLPGVP